MGAFLTAAGEGQVFFEEATAAINELVAIESQDAKAAHESAHDSFKEGRTTMLLFVVIAVIAALGLGFVLSRAISTPLRRPVEVLKIGRASGRDRVVRYG